MVGLAVQIVLQGTESTEEPPELIYYHIYKASVESRKTQRPETRIAAINLRFSVGTRPMRSSPCPRVIFRQLIDLYPFDLTLAFEVLSAPRSLVFAIKLKLIQLTLTFPGVATATPLAR